MHLHFNSTYVVLGKLSTLAELGATKCLELALFFSAPTALALASALLVLAATAVTSCVLVAFTRVFAITSNADAGWKNVRAQSPSKCFLTSWSGR